MRKLPFSCKTLLLFTSLTVIACATKQSNVLAQNTSFLLEWQKPLQGINKSTIEKTFTEQSIRVNSAENVLTGREDIVDHILATNLKTLSGESLFSTVANKIKLIDYEIIKSKTEDTGEHLHILIWKTVDSMRQIDFEYKTTYNTNPIKADSLAIEKSRDQWMTLCNAHNAEKLVNDMYTENTLYYSHRPLVKGRTALSKEYAYMNNESYQLELKPLSMQIANEDTALEIGQCEGSYNGKYIIIWKKGNDDIWRVFIDSNI